MPSRVPRALRLLLGKAPTALVLGGLAALFVWGMKSDWKIKPRRAQGAAKDDKKDDKTDEKKEEDSDEVALKGEDTAQKAGFEDVSVSSERLDERVRASAVLAYNPDRYAHLATRAPGTVWRPGKGKAFRELVRLGAWVNEGDPLALVAAAEAGKARADLLQALIQRNVRKATLERLRSAAEAVPERQIVEARSALREAEARALIDRQSLVNLGLPVNLGDLERLADGQLERRLRGLGLPPDLVDEQGDSLPGTLLPLRAPFEGQIVKREVVTPDKPLLALADTRKLLVLLDVRPEDVGRLAVGQPVEFRASATQQVARGELTWISPEVDAKTRTVRARALVDNPRKKDRPPLRPQTFGTAWVTVGGGPALTVPVAAVQWDGKLSKVFVRKGPQKFEARIVFPGARYNGRVQLLDSRLLLAAGLQGMFRGPDQALPAAAFALRCGSLLEAVESDDRVVTTGAHTLMSELLKERISGED